MHCLRQVNPPKGKGRGLSVDFLGLTRKFQAGYPQLSDKSGGGPEFCSPKSGAPALTHLARVAMRSDPHLHLRPQTHSSLTPVQVDRSLLSHPRLFPAASFHH